MKYKYIQHRHLGWLVRVIINGKWDLMRVHDDFTKKVYDWLIANKL